MKADAKVDQVITAVRDIKAGETIQEADVTSHTVTTVTCHNPKCGVEITWCQEDVAKDQNSAPEAFFRILTLQRSYVDPADAQAGDTGKYPFCSAYCLSRWLAHCYTPSVSPAERRRQDEAKGISAAVPQAAQALAEAATKPEEKFDALKEQPEFPAVPESGIVMPSVEVAPLTPETAKEIVVGVPGVIEDEISGEEDLDTNSPQWN